MRTTAWIALALLAGGACAVGTTEPDSTVGGQADAAPSSSGDADGAGPSYGDGASSTVDSGGGATDGGAGSADSGTTSKDAAAKDTGGGTPCASPTMPADCDASCGSGSHAACTANGCYNGYVCNTALHKCTAPGTCP